MSEELSKDQVSFYEKNQANYNTETLFTEMYRTMVKCMGEMAKHHNSSVDKNIQGKYLWILTNMSWATLRVSVMDDHNKIKKMDEFFSSEIMSLEDAKIRVFKLLELGAEAGILIRQDYGITDYDNMFSKQGII
jgi:ATP-dependent Lon protease